MCIQRDITCWTCINSLVTDLILYIDVNFWHNRWFIVLSGRLGPTYDIESGNRADTLWDNFYQMVFLTENPQKNKIDKIINFNGYYCF